MSPKSPQHECKPHQTVLVAWLVVALTAVALLVSWLAMWPQGGFGFKPRPFQYKGSWVAETNGLLNWHALLMLLGFVVCMPAALLAYNVQLPAVRVVPRPARKISHVALHAVAGLCLAVGMIAVFVAEQKAIPSKPHVFSAHSYMGLLAVAAYVVQFGLGIVAFVAPRFTDTKRSAFSPVHVFAGLCTWLVGVASVVTGIAELQFIIYLGYQSGGGSYSNNVLLASVLQLCVVLATMLLGVQMFMGRRQQAALQHGVV